MVWRTCLPRAILFVTTLLLLVQCGPTRQTYWVNSGYEPEMQQQQFTLDSTECMALANRLIPEPKSGTIEMDTPRGRVYGTYQDQPSFSGGGLLGGWLEAERAHTRRDYAAACMAKRGWQQRVIEK